METKFSEILNLVSEITKSMSCYILMTNNSVQIIDSVGTADLSTDLIAEFNNDIKNYGINSKNEFKNWISSKEIKEKNSIENIDIIPLTPQNETQFFLVILSADKIEESDKAKYDVYVKTISRLVELETKIKISDSEERLKLLIGTAVDFIFSLNGFGYILEVNESGANALGYSVDEMLGKHFLDFINESKRTDITASFQKMLTNKSTTHFEIDFLHKLKKPITYEFLATPLLENNSIVGMMGIGRDVSRRKKNEEIIKGLNEKLGKANRLVAIERDRAKKQITVLEELNLLKNEFISNVSHELRTPLASIVGFAETLSTDEDLDPDLINEFSTIILAEGKRLARFIEDILDFSKLEENSKNINKEKCDLLKIIEDVIIKIAPLIEEKKITLITEIPEAEITIFADKEKLVKAFFTIVENAIHYAESNGQVTIFVQDFLKEVEIFISNSGAGIPEKELKMFFDKFHSTGSTVSKPPLAGAALSLAKQIIEYHEGVLQIKSIVGEGITMILHLPKIIN